MCYVVTLKQNKSRDPKNHNTKWFIICTSCVLNSMNTIRNILLLDYFNVAGVNSKVSLFILTKRNTMSSLFYESCFPHKYPESPPFYPLVRRGCKFAFLFKKFSLAVKLIFWLSVQVLTQHVQNNMPLTNTRQRN